MDSTLYRLVYLSRNTIVGDDSRLQEEIDDILKASRRNNSRAQVTGALMFNSGCFAQVLEGPHDKIQETFERIQCDARHTHVSVLAFDPVHERGFSEWNMAYVGQDAHNLALFAGLNEASGVDFAALDGDEVYRLLRGHLEEAETA
ncbi:Sensors of blue-light using FAD [Modicisalibacter ilicicola DSM 19980]|uniref:Sensors of blue-light using FAD n=1 Tax=Modicisalibacter ilicicola DSM 19980 TaxID=1121942 RepID=A0A1M4W9C6_9GAMM|nr:BLUF domain-containing protein [Halomonas ilicicola]SHE77836.1 Sensors of blue-light using FAD [Halomonas ilicicola DSM 19980]